MNKFDKNYLRKYVIAVMVRKLDCLSVNCINSSKFPNLATLGLAISLLSLLFFKYLVHISIVDKNSITVGENC